MKKLLAALVAWGPGGLFLAALIDGAGVPVPGGVDVLIIYLAGQRPENPALLALVAVAGSTIGNMLLFLLARRGGELYLDKRHASKRARHFRQWFHHYGLLTVFIAALVPLPVMPMKVFVLCAGALGSSPSWFALTFIAARIPRYWVLAVLGRRMGNNAFGYIGDHVVLLSICAGGLFALLYVLVKFADWVREKKLKKAGAADRPAKAD